MSKSSSTDSIINWLFETKAIRVASPDQPFWYTSGTLGPYYINTHFLYGSQEQAENLLHLIENLASDPMNMPAKLAENIMLQYEQNQIFRSLIDQMITRLGDLKFDLISGGERRDFFFSVPIARLLGKPHLTIMKDCRCFLSEQDFSITRSVSDSELDGMISVHIADLVTEASSYLRAWIPAIRNLGAAIKDTLVVVDRGQGAEAILSGEGVSLHSLICIDDRLFELAVQSNLMTCEQQTQIALFTRDPHMFMVEFLDRNPDFLEEQLKLGGKTAQRAQLCIDQGYGK